MLVVVSGWARKSTTSERVHHISPPSPIRTDQRVPGQRGVGWDVGIGPSLPAGISLSRCLYMVQMGHFPDG